MGALQNTINHDAPIIAKLIEDGVKDGSLKTTQPVLCAEIFLMLLNYWASPLFFKRNSNETRERLTYLQYIMTSLGLDIIDNEFIESVISGCEKTGMF